MVNNRGLSIKEIMFKLMSVSIQIEEVFMLAIGSVSGLCHASRMVAMEMTVNFYKYNTALYKILINKPL